MTEPTYREIDAADLPIAQELRAKMLREMQASDPDVNYPGWRRRYIEFYEPRINQQRAAVYVAVAGDAPIGVAVVYLLTNHRTEILGYEIAYVSNVWVEPAWRKRGIASRLMRMVVDWAKRQGCQGVRLRSSQMARPVYASLGFTPTDEMELRLA